MTTDQADVTTAGEEEPTRLVRTLGSGDRLQFYLDGRQIIEIEPERNVQVIIRARESVQIEQVKSAK